jgi:hypothetical protein
MNFKQIVNLPLVAPMILEYVQTKDERLRKALEEYDLVDDNGLRPIVAENLEMLRYNYEYSMGVKRYDQLRRGLAEHYHNRLDSIWTDLDMIHGDYSLLDFGCGAGQYGKTYKNLNPAAPVDYLDRDIDFGFSVDFEANPTWYKEFEQEYDYVLVAEVFHCKETSERYKLMTDLLRVAVQGIVIVETNDPFMDYRLRNEKQSSCMSEAAVYNLTDKFSSKLQLQRVVHNGFHTFYKFLVRKHNV